MPLCLGLLDLDYVTSSASLALFSLLNNFFFILSNGSVSRWFVAKTRRMKCDLISSSPDCNIDLYTITNLLTLISSSVVRI